MSAQIRPKTIRLEATTHCQLKCPSCETTQGKTHEKLGKGFLRFMDFQALVDKNPWLSHIELSNWGEIFLNPDLLKIIRYAHSNNLALTASNGVNLNTVKKELLEALVKYKFRNITCSIDGASQETYKIYRQGGNFEQVIDNIMTINMYKQLYKSQFPILTWQFVVFGHNQQEIHTAQAFAKSLNMNFLLKLSWDERFSPVTDNALISSFGKLDVASRSEYVKKYGRDYLQIRICSQLWHEPQINWNGKILGCCFNYWDDYGNAFTTDLGESLNSEKINYARQMLLGKVEARFDIPCTKCTHYQRMSTRANWLTMQDVNSALSKSETYPYLLGRFGVWLGNNLPFWLDTLGRWTVRPFAR